MNKMTELLCVAVLLIICGFNEMASTTFSTQEAMADDPQKTMLDNSQIDIYDDFWNAYCYKLWRYLWEGGPISSFGRGSLRGNHNSAIPQNVTENTVCDTYAIGLCAELSYSAYKEKNLYKPLLLEIRYPQLYIHADAVDPLPFDQVRSINKILYETAKSMMSYDYCEAYSNYDIECANDSMISICFYGLVAQSGQPYYPFSTVTIDLRDGSIMHLEDFIDTDILTVDSILSEYTFMQKNNFLLGGTSESELRLMVENFLDDLDRSDNFFISDESDNGIILVLRSGRYYFMFGQCE